MSYRVISPLCYGSFVLQESKTLCLSKQPYAVAALCCRNVRTFFSFSDGPTFAVLVMLRIESDSVWGAVCKNIISDRFSTKTAISGRDVICGRDSYLCMQRCYLWQR